MEYPVIPASVFNFLNDLERNNDRDWFKEHKNEYDTINESAKNVFIAISELVKQHDTIEKLKFFRIYRDVRFSKNKAPYKINRSASLTRAGTQLRGGYYIHLQPKGSFIATGFWKPEKEDLLRIRKEWEVDASEFRELMMAPKFKKTWGALAGDELKTAPKGFDKEHPNIDLIRKKQFTFVKNFSDEEVMDASFVPNVNEAFKTIRPFFDLMSDVLTTNLNGESLL